MKNPLRRQKKIKAPGYEGPERRRKEKFLRLLPDALKNPVTWAGGLIGGLLFTGMFFYATVIVPNDIRSDTSREQRLQANQLLEEIHDELYRNCKADRKFRLQYKVRGKAEDKLLQVFIDLAEENVKIGAPDASISQDFIDQFKPLEEKIKIYPVAQCSRLKGTIKTDAYHGES